MSKLVDGWPLAFISRMHENVKVWLQKKRFKIIQRSTLSVFLQVWVLYHFHHVMGKGTGMHSHSANFLFIKIIAQLQLLWQPSWNTRNETMTNICCNIVKCVFIFRGDNWYWLWWERPEYKVQVDRCGGP